MENLGGSDQAELSTQNKAGRVVKKSYRSVNTLIRVSHSYLTKVKAATIHEQKTRMALSTLKLAASTYGNLAHWLLD